MDIRNLKHLITASELYTLLRKYKREKYFDVLCKWYVD